MKTFTRYLVTGLVSAAIGCGGGVSVYRALDDHPLSPDPELKAKPILVADLNRDGVPDVLSRDRYGSLVVTFGENPNRYKWRQPTRDEKITDAFNRTCIRGNLERVGLNTLAQNFSYPTFHWMKEFE